MSIRHIGVLSISYKAQQDIWGKDPDHGQKYHQLSNAVDLVYTRLQELHEDLDVRLVSANFDTTDGSLGLNAVFTSLGDTQAIIDEVSKNLKNT